MLFKHRNYVLYFKVMTVNFSLPASEEFAFLSEQEKKEGKIKNSETHSDLIARKFPLKRTQLLLISEIKFVNRTRRGKLMPSLKKCRNNCV